MNWVDLLYFSRGERRVLTLLLLLVLIYWGWSSYGEQQQEQSLQSEESVQQIVVDSVLITSKPVVVQANPSSSVQSPIVAFSRVSSAVREKKSKHSYQEKLPAGSVVELNSADTTMLKKIPGIGSSFARRIVKYRDLLGGYAFVEQLQEVYGMDSDRYSQISTWFTVDVSRIHPLNVNMLTFAELLRHPYLNKEQVRAIDQLRRQKKRLSGWENLSLLEEFTQADQARLTPYLSFE